MKYIFFVVFFVIPFVSSAQEDTDPLEVRKRTVHSTDPSSIKDPLKLYEDSLVFFADSMYYSGIADFRKAGNYEFIKMMKKVLNMPASFAYPFDTLKQRINIIEPSNKNFRIYNWEVMTSDFGYRYYGALQIPTNNGVKIYPLIDVSDQIQRGAEDSVFTNNNWYGALYYNLMEKSYNGSKIYFLLGFNAAGLNSDKKIIETFYIDKNDKLVFGLPIFPRTKGSGNANRYIYEYQKDSRATFNYQAEYDMIIFDHLESNIGDNNKRYTFVPDGTYDGLRWSGSGWQLVPNAVQVVPSKDAPLEAEFKK